ncbi:MULTISPECIES: uroporphyrinogen-III synthase [unclassified Neisseria]|uniref:uroporphyrinogen-III synthase n=1 Tax=unclassified Neisseria TaxID=2623750 RepID=UPI002666D3A1|nr:MULTISPECIES: uroporphyrinogen-III synthase [unclassified Neisseria]MDO1510457.1 uroporphyrinogen-III synthase [Neisseria sp. MVDL19-042950]MDO1516626.1 uroporphyrinogen-III synthase [Neisseria sp. MVDL18-041461]MDO1563772.1 uroporphyrinogen-III synthase [Neisseria sp. MVDL20-010259]
MPAILIIRPPSQTAADIRTCTAAGWDAVPFGPIRIEPEEAALKNLNRQFQTASAVFWVSPTAVETAAPHIDFSDGLIRQITVGQGSRKALSGFCPHEIICPQEGNDSEAVLRLDIWNSLPQGAKVLIVRGHGGRDFLAQNLKRRGFEVETAEVYFRRPQPLDWSVFEEARPVAAYITSAEMVSALFAQVPSELAQPLRTLLYFTHHPRIAAALHIAGAVNTRVVARLDAQTLKQALHGVQNEQPRRK